MNKIKKATKIENLETFIKSLKDMELINFQEMRNIVEYSNQIRDIENAIDLLQKEKEELVLTDQKEHTGERFTFLKDLTLKQHKFEQENKKLTGKLKFIEGKLISYLKEAHNIFYTIGCENLVNRVDLKNDFISKENIKEVLRIIESRMNEVLFVYHTITVKVILSAESWGERERE